MLPLEGPYAPAVLRFHVSFPDDYPTLPPVLTFISDVFHPLVTPQTTHTYTTGASETDTVSATDDERLPPGGFSLRHGFPHWLERGRESAASSRRVSESLSQLQHQSPRPSHVESKLDRLLSPSRVPPGGKGYPGPSENGEYTPIVEVLEYVKSALIDEAILDSIPLEAAANSGAYHAWRAHRAELQLTTRALSPQASSPASKSVSREKSGLLGGHSSNVPIASKARLPGEWNWTGVWEERVKKCTQNSLSEPVLFGSASGSIDMVYHSQCSAEDEKLMLGRSVSLTWTMMRWGR